MTTLQPSDIVFVFSGGISNNDPTFSLGGDPSTVIIGDGINNLFADISDADATSGATNYRCFYVFNDNESGQTLHGATIWIDSQVADGSTMQLGVLKQNDTQIITTVGNPTGGDLQFSQNGGPVVVANFDSTVSTWALHIQNAINTLPGITEATVSASTFGNINTFQMSFQGVNSNRYESLLMLAANNLTPTGINVSIAKLVDGSPINAVAVDIDQDTTPPTGIVFQNTSAISPIFLGDLLAGDGVPVWIQRVTPANSTALAGDGFTLKFSGNPIQS